MAINEFYKCHVEAWERDSIDQSRDIIHSSWFRTDTADYWRHARMYEGAKAFAHRPELTWLTIGDGRFGLDSIRIRNFGFKSVLPTDIGGALLSRAKAQGLIPGYAVENAERLSFADDSFDLAFCKESYHHCPRAPLVLYEMLRVARHAVVLVEPRDYVIDRPPCRAVGPLGLLRGLYTWLTARVGLPQKRSPLAQRYITGDPPHYEESGNYMYTISSRELEKVALGMNLPVLALKGLNDCYISGGETELASEESVVFNTMCASIRAADKATEGGRTSTSLLLAILFKEPPDEQARAFLRTSGWLLIDLPGNPHVSSNDIALSH